jgi:hypothetical protein
MGAFAGTLNVYEQDTGPTIEANSPFGYKEIIIYSDATLAHTNTFTVDLAKYGIATLKFAKSFIHSTLGSVIVPDTAVSTVVSGTTVTFTVNGAGGAKERAFLIGGI